MEKPLFLMAVVYFAFMSIASVFPADVAGRKPDAVNLKLTLKPPSKNNIFGTDEIGRDIFARVLHGARVSLLAAFMAQAISFTIGVLVGTVAGYNEGRWPDNFLSFIMASFHAFPFLLFVLAVTAALGPGIYKVMIAIGIVNWVAIARVIRGQVISAREREYVLAAKAFGFSPARVLFKYILPNILSSAIVVAVIGFGDVVAVEAGLSFLGMGVQPPTASWGKMIFVGKNYITNEWWMSLFPGMFLVLTILSFNTIGEALEKRWRRK